MMSYRLIKSLLRFSIIFAVIIFVSANNYVKGGSRFISDYACSDTDKYCASSGGTRTVEGFEVYRDCWEWGYTKTCHYPSKNDCAQHAHCYSLGRRNCLLKDHYGACINWEKEFSCKRWVPTYIESETVRYGSEDKEGQEGLVCKGIPCIDGNCVDKSYEMDEDMMDSVSKLYALSQGQSDGYNFKIFEGVGRHCSKKPVGYSNCCRVEKPGDGWGKNIGAKCKGDEKYLMEQRQKNLCVYVGKVAKKKVGVTTVVKHHFCCFSNILEKIIQEQGRAQLGMNFGSGGNSDCRGLTLEELERIDFSLIDFSEFVSEIQKRMVIPSGGDVEERIYGALPNIKRFDEQRPSDVSNKLSGVNLTMTGPSLEEKRQEEERLERERQEEERLAKIEAERLEQERLAKLEAERLEQEKLAKLEEERLRKLNRERYTARIHASRRKMKEIQAEMKSSQKKKSKAWHELGLATSEWEKTGRWYPVSSPHRETYLDKMRKPQEEIRRLDTRILQLRAEYNSQKQIAYSRYCPNKKY